MDNKHHPWWVCRTVVSKRGTKEGFGCFRPAICCCDEKSLIAHENWGEAEQQCCCHSYVETTQCCVFLEHPAYCRPKKHQTQAELAVRPIITGRKIDISDAMLSGPVLKTAITLATCVTLFGLMSCNAAACEKDKGVDCLISYHGFISYHGARACGVTFIMPIPWRYRSASTIRVQRRS